MHAYLKGMCISPESPFMRACNKKAYVTRLAARSAMNRHSHKDTPVAVGEGRSNVYRCRYCELWHYGHAR